jgi:hypothetical protein
VGAGGLASTADDLVQFADSFSDGGKHLLSQSSLSEMIKPQLSRFAQHAIEQTGINPEFYYGLGLDITALPSYQAEGIYVIGKGGDTNEYHSMLLSATQHRLSVAVLQVGHGNSASNIAVDIFNAILQQKGLMHKEAVSPIPQAAECIPAEYAKFEGYYAPQYKISFDFTTNTCVLTYLLTNGASYPLTLVYSDGYFYTADWSTKFVFIIVDGQNYMVVSCIGNLLFTVWGQQLPKLDNPLSLSIDLNGEQWLRRNVERYEQPPPSLAPAHIVTSITLDGLPGYVNFEGIKVVNSSSYAAVPAEAVRDQKDLTLIDRDGQVWARLYDCMYSPASVATPLKAGNNTVTISDSGRRHNTIRQRINPRRLICNKRLLRRNSWKARRHIHCYSKLSSYSILF